MDPPEGPPGPDPSSLETTNDVPDGIIPETFRITYSTDRLSDHVSLDKSERHYILELADPLLSLVRKAGRVDQLKSELEDALAAFGVGSIVSHFNGAIAEYVNALLPVDAFPETIALSTAAYLLKKMYDANLLRLGQIHQASIEELPKWMEFFDKAQRNPGFITH